MCLLHSFRGINYWGLTSISAGGAAGPAWHGLCCALGASVPGPAPVTMGQKVPIEPGVWIPPAQGLDLGGLFHMVPVSLWDLGGVFF